MIKSEILKRLEKIELALNNEGKQKKIIQAMNDFADYLASDEYNQENEKTKELIKGMRK